MIVRTSTLKTMRRIDKHERRSKIDQQRRQLDQHEPG